MLDIALFQYRISASFEENLQQVLQLKGRVKKGECDVIIFPELSLAPYPRDGQLASLVQFEDKNFQKLSRLANTLQTHLLIGLQVGTKERSYNTAVMINPHGKISFSYAKQKLFTPWEEEKFVQAGAKGLSFELKSFRLVPLVCFDLRFPELFRNFLGSELFVVQANWPSERVEHWLCLLQARAIENQAYVVGVNCCGERNGILFAGQSVVIDPKGKVMLNMGPNEDFQKVSLDLQALRNYRESFPVLEV